MATTLLRDVLFVATTLVLVACGSGGGDSGGGSSSSGNALAAATSAAAAAASTAAAPTATPSATSVALAWNANTDADLASYKVYVSTSSGMYGAAVATVPKPSTSFVVTGLQTSVTYFFVITAVDTSGNESPRSAEVSATPS